MTIQILKKTDYSTAQWSGGKTTEIGIGPKGACYADRDFLWRVSSATVDLTESTFTSLPDYQRWIATLDHPITLVHDEEAPVPLPSFTPHFFDGASLTRSFGSCTDFNLMLRKGRCRGTIQAVRTCPEGTPLLTQAASNSEQHTIYIYCANGAAQVQIGDTAYPVGENECLLIDAYHSESIRISGDTQTRCITAEIIACA